MENWLEKFQSKHGKVRQKPLLTTAFPHPTPGRGSRELGPTNQNFTNKTLIPEDVTEARWILWFQATTKSQEASGVTAHISVTQRKTQAVASRETVPEVRSSFGLLILLRSGSFSSYFPWCCKLPDIFSIMFSSACINKGSLLFLETESTQLQFSLIYILKVSPVCKSAVSQLSFTPIMDMSSKSCGLTFKAGLKTTHFSSLSKPPCL